MIEYLNANPGMATLIGALFVALTLSVLMIARLRAMTRTLNTRLNEMERYRRHQHQDLSSRMEMTGERTNRELQLVGQLLSTSAQANEERIERMMARMNLALTQQQQQMTEMRETVDHKLQATLEKRLGESFKQVGEQLERVYKGLGEMKHLAQGVGDLKRVLAGVKTRGVWGEVRLKALLEQNLTREQYFENTAVEPGGRERVEFAVVLPGKEANPILLPIDAKFPQESYQRLLDAAEAGDKAAIEQAGAALERVLTDEAKRIASKYIRVPHTTDFAVMFLPIEGLFAEALRISGLCEKLQDKYRIMVSGPTTLSALLTSLQMGFQTLAVEQRSEEIWRLLGAVRGEFYQFGEALERTRQRLDQAGAELDQASTRTRQITKKLSKVDELTIPENWQEGSEP